jgi:MFS family permease
VSLFFFFKGPLTPTAAGAPLLRSRENPHHQISIRTLLSTPTLRGPALFVTAVLCLQQLSGVNAVLFYSSSVLETILPNAGAGALSVGITVVNALMTFPAIFLVDSLGRRPLLLISATGMGIMSMLLAYGLDEHKTNLSAFAIVSFIVSKTVL